MKRLILLFLASVAYASVNEPMRLEWQSGYRNDNFHWHLQNPGDDSALTYSEHYKNLQYWENALSLRVIYRDIAVGVRGAYGALGSGQLRQRLASQPYEPRLAYSTQNWTADGWGYFGYAVNLTPDRTYLVAFVPYVGFGVNYTQIHPTAVHSCWYGPLVGGYFLIQPGGRMQFEAGYAYHWLSLRFKDHWTVDGAPFKTRAKNSGSLEQSGWLKLDFLLSKVWRLGLATQIQYFSSPVLNVTVSETPQKFKARWTAVSGGLTLSRSL